MEDLYRTLPKLLRLAPDAEEVTQAAAFVAWRRVAGDALRLCAIPFRLHRKTLVVSVPDEAWQRQLDHMRWNLISRINALLQGTFVTNIEFRIDPQTIRRARADDPRAHESRTDQQRDARDRSALDTSQSLKRAASAIEDEELRKRFLLAAGCCLDANSGRPEQS